MKKYRLKKSILIYIVFVILSGCKTKTDSNLQTFHNEDFKWTITIPEKFTTVSPDEWGKLQNKGAQAVEKTYSEKVENQSTAIFVFKNGEYNYLESNYQQFDPEVDGDYRESCKVVNEIVYETFRTQIPNAKIDSASFVEKISGLDFHTFKVALDLPNGMKIHTFTYNRLFGNKDFAINITYVDEEAGERMKEAWFGSKFK
ncbi:MAG: hypothetical protein WEB30_10195 [Cyclobacteriaceae bacterium]